MALLQLISPVIRAAIAACGLLGALTARGQTIWDGGAGTGNWADAANWNPNVVPLSGTAIQFAGAVQTTVDTQANRSPSTLAFNAGAGAFTINNNTLTLTGITNNSSVTQTINSALQLTANRTFTTALVGANLTLAGNLALSNSATSRTLTLTGAGNHTVTGVIANGGTATAGAVTKSGAGTAVLSGVNTYGGTTSVNAGVLRATNANALGTGALSMGGGTLQLAADSATVFGRNTAVGTNSAIQSDRLTAGAGVTQTLGTLSIGSRILTVTAGSNVTSGTAGLAFGATTITGSSIFSTGAGTQLTLGPLQATAARSIAKNGAGTVLFNAPSTGWITGSALTVNNGSALLGANNVFGATALTNVTVNATVAGATARFDLDGFNATVTSLTFGGTGGTTTSTSNVATGGGILTLGGNVTYTNIGNPLGSTLSGNLALGAASRIFTINDSASTAAELIVSAAIAGGAGVAVTKAGAGRLILSGANTYAGATTVSAGVLRAASDTALGSTAAGGSVASGAALELIGGITIGAESFTLAGTGVGGTGALLNVGGNNTFGGALTLSAATTIGSAAGTLTLNGPGLNTGGNALTFAGAGDISLMIALGGTAGFTKTGAGALSLDTVFNTTGTVVLAGGTLRLGGLGQTIGTLQVTGDSILDFAGASTLNLTNLSVSAGVVLTIANWVDTVDFFRAFNNPGAPTLARVDFTAPYVPADTKWQSYDNQITPVPEPSTYGALLLAAAAALVYFRRRKSK